MQYAGDVSAKDCWSRLKEDSNAALVDVRTRAEWSFVGIPDLSAVTRKPLLVEWQSFPTMAVNTAFVEQVKEQASLNAPIFCLCRSGARSAAAAATLTAAGFTQAFNIAAGFEGDVNHESHRGTLNGWKADGLPWGQS